ncbi:DUF2993 domain-containing protein [Nocardia huaxiensis]|uniref:DUF2993 domain-containing protein n=1 Tax=Nocardia huaxiensis TaxID=2755382 RepID=A0A7D6VGL7_9NOCA|nr:DUF2993 domain-containing protein [Nocardia huaxiensis]
MSSKPTPDDATNRAQDPGAHSPSPPDPATEVIGSGKDAGQNAANVNEWWQETGEQPTAVLGKPDASHPTEVLGTPQGGTDPQATEVLGATPPNTPRRTEVLDAGEAAAYAAGAQSVSGAGQPPAGPPPGSSVDGEGGSPRAPRKRRTALIVAIVAALVIVGGLAGGEAYARNKVQNCIASSFEKQMGSKIDVSFGAKPMLLTMIDNKVGKVTIDSDDTKFGPAVGMVVHATFNDIEVKDGGKQGGTIGSSEAEVTWSNEGIVQTLGGLVSSSTSDPAAGTLNFGVLMGIAQLQVVPQVVGDKVDVETKSASLLGIGLPTDLVSGIVDLMTESLQSYPMGLKPTKVEVTNDGLRVTLKGGPSTLEAPDGSQSNTDFRC